MEKADVEEKCHMKRKVIVIAGVLLAAIIAITVFMRMMGGSGVGIDNDPEAEVKGDSNVLVAYFSWSGNGQQMAGWISEETGGELFRIVPSESYGEDFDSCADRAKNELDNEIRPELSEHIDAETMARYDVIYLGFPVWWYDLPMPVWTFLEEYDLSGKTVIPFFSHNGSSNGANSVKRVAELADGATVLTENALSLRGSNVSGSEQEVKEWVKDIGK
ncbi:flavodoxin [Roseburia sp. 1XD42-69]|nr:flavodoxin [Roseburia sp. 1XD42-69]